MPQKDKRIDAYIAKAPEYSQPILKHLRGVVHKAYPDVEETLKWGMPSFLSHGAILCGMAAFKKHSVFMFWKMSLIKDPHKLFSEKESAMGSLGKITSLKDVPSSKILSAYIKEAVALNEKGIKVVRKPASNEKKTLVVPSYFKKEIAENKKAQKTFDAFSYSNKKEYVEWITEAKTEATREKRMATALEWMAEGKIRNWKYVKK